MKNLQPGTSHLIPKQWRPQGSKELIYTYIGSHLQSLREGRNLEIELRLGSCDFKQKNRVNANSYAKAVRDLSIQNPLIIGCTYSPLKKKFRMKSNTFLKEIGHRFNPKIQESLFMSRLELLKKFENNVKKEEQETGKLLDNRITSHNDFSIDFLPENKSRHLGRFTFDIQNLKYINTAKEDKTNVDIIHQGIDYRISAAYERNQELERQEFLRKIGLIGCKFARVKARTSFRFQFLEFSFTRTYEISDRSQLNHLMYIAKKDIPENPEELKTLALSFMIRNQVPVGHEIEIEVVDVPFLLGIMKKDYFGFTRLVDRMLRNAEILSSYPDEFSQADYRRLFEGEKGQLEFPVIGEYLNRIVEDK